MDPHKNLFYYYRGPSRRFDAETIWDTQLEDNTTKALVNVFDALPFKTGLAPFLGLIGVEVEDLADKSLGTELQRIPEVAKQAEQRFAVLITPAKALPATIQVGGRPDAIIFARDGSFACVIESKIFRWFSQQQLEGHLSALGWPAEIPWKRVSWEEIHTAYQEMDGLAEPAVTLRRHFTEYLDMIGLAPFAGFNEQDFDYFVRPADEYGALLKEKLRRFITEVHNRLPTEFQDAYPEVYVGRVSNKGDDRGMWSGFRFDQQLDDPFKHCNVTLELDSEGLSINAVIRDGRPDQPWTAAGAFSQQIRDQNEILNALSLGKDFSIRFYERVGRNGGRIMPGYEEWLLCGTLRLDRQLTDILEFAALMLKSIRYPGIHVRRHFRRGTDILEDGEALLNEAVTTVLQLAPVLTAIRSS